MLARLRRRNRVRIMLPLLVALAACLPIAASPATASNAATVITFEKHWVGGPPSHYVGTTSDGGTIEMWVHDPSVVGNVQKFTAELRLSIDDSSLTAMLSASSTSALGRWC